MDRTLGASPGPRIVHQQSASPQGQSNKSTSEKLHELLVESSSPFAHEELITYLSSLTASDFPEALETLRTIDSSLSSDPFGNNDTDILKFAFAHWHSLAPDDAFSHLNTSNFSDETRRGLSTLSLLYSFRDNPEKNLAGLLTVPELHRYLPRTQSLA